MEVCCGEYGEHQDKMVSAIDNGRAAYNEKIKEVDETAMDEVNLSGHIALIKEQETPMMDPTEFEHDSGWIKQFCILIMRMWLQMWRDKVNIRLIVSEYLHGLATIGDGRLRIYLEGIRIC